MKSFISYCNRVKVKWYGHTFLNDHGEKGSCEGFYVKIKDVQKGYEPLTNKELEIISQCKREAYSDLNEKIASIDEAYHSGEISKKERDERVGAIDT